jgi:hypothetical protein
MGVIFQSEPELEDPYLIAAWPGMGNVGVIAVDTLREVAGAQPFAEIEPWDLFYPHTISIKDGKLQDLTFPSSRFYFQRLGSKNVIFFIGEEQPQGEEKMYQMANLVLDVGQRFSCRRIYTGGAAVAPIHHTSKPKVWAVPNTEGLINEVKGYSHATLMSGIQGEGKGNITGLNGLLLGVAKKRGIPGICLLGEVPIYLSSFPLSYPKASKAVLETLSQSWGIDFNLESLDSFIQEVDRNIEELYQKVPPVVKDKIDQLKHVDYIRSGEPEPITEEDKERLMEDIEQFFNKGDKD